MNDSKATNKMNNSIIFFLTGLVLGGLITGFALYKSSPKLLLQENQSKYNFDESLAILESEIEESEWSLSNKHDLQATLIKHGKDNIKNATVVELCHPDLAEEILLSDKAKVVSNMMPCRIAFYEKSDGKTYYSRMNSGLLAKAMGGLVKDQMTVAFDDMEAFLRILESDDN